MAVIPSTGGSLLIHNVSGNAPRVSPLSTVLALGLWYICIAVLREYPSVSIALSIFIVNECWILSDFLFYRDNCDFFSLRFNCVFIHVNVCSCC